MLPPVVAVWTEDDVQKWLEQAGLPSLKETFRMNNVNGDTLLSLSKETFEQDLNVRDRHVLDQLLAAHLTLFDELEVRDWSVDQVAAFVSSIGFRHYATMMREACIDGFGLVALSLSEMKSAVGIASLGHRRKIRGAIDSILRRQRPKKAGVGGRPASAIKQVFERTLPTSSPFDNDSHSESSVNLTSVASNSRSLQKAEEQLSMLSSQAAKALSKLEQCERRVHLLRQQAPRPDSEGAALAKAKVKVLPGGVVKGDSSGECTFSPNIAPNSRRIIHETRRNTISFNDRMESYLQRKRHNMSEICKEVSHAAGGVVVGQRELRRRQEAATFFQEVLGWDVVKGVSPAEIERVLQSPQNFGIKITEVCSSVGAGCFAITSLTFYQEEKAAVRKLKGGDQLMALFNLFCIQGPHHLIAPNEFVSHCTCQILSTGRWLT